MFRDGAITGVLRESMESEMGVSNSRVNLPRISIVTPSYNQGDYLEQTILSVLEQNYPNMEHIIIDGGSTDSSLDIIKKYEKKLKYWVSEPDRGQSHAINKGLSHATGDLLVWLNSDDCLMPDALHEIARAFNAHPSAGAIVGIGRIVNAAGEVIYYKEPTDEISVESLYQWMDEGNFMQPSSYFSRRAWEECGPLDEEVHFAFELDFWLRMAKRGFEFVVLKKLLSTALSHERAKTTAFVNLMRVDIVIILMRHGGEKAVRKHLESMAQRLSQFEWKFNKVMDNPMAKILHPFIKLFFKRAVRRRDALPEFETFPAAPSARESILPQGAKPGTELDSDEAP